MPLIVGVVAENRAYLQTKANRMGREINQMSWKSINGAATGVEPGVAEPQSTV